VAAGRPFVARVDIETFFDSVPHGRLLADLPAWLDDKRYLALARDWIRASAPNGRGLPQGSPISPTLANIVLDPIDRQMASEGFAAVRYADDIAVFCRSSGEARDALKWIGDRLATRGLRVNAAKSRVCHAAGAMFLGQMLAPPLSGWSAFIAKIVRRDPDRASPSPRA